MEPLACLFGCVDIFFAYLFWYFYEEQFIRYQEKVPSDSGRNNEFLELEWDHELTKHYIQRKKSLLGNDVKSIVEFFASHRLKRHQSSDDS